MCCHLHNEDDQQLGHRSRDCISIHIGSRRVVVGAGGAVVETGVVISLCYITIIVIVTISTSRSSISRRRRGRGRRGVVPNCCLSKLVIAVIVPPATLANTPPTMQLWHREHAQGRHFPRQSLHLQFPVVEISARRAVLVQTLHPLAINSHGLKIYHLFGKSFRSPSDYRCLLLPIPSTAAKPNRHSEARSFLVASPGPEAPTTVPEWNLVPEKHAMAIAGDPNSPQYVLCIYFRPQCWHYLHTWILKKLWVFGT